MLHVCSWVVFCLCAVSTAVGNSSYGGGGVCVWASRGRQTSPPFHDLLIPLCRPYILSIRGSASPDMVCIIGAASYLNNLPHVLQTLMGSLQNSKGFAAIKKQVASFSGKAGTPSAPVHKTAELRCPLCSTKLCVYDLGEVPLP